MRLRQVLSGKIHRATVTEANVDYIGSITVDEDLLERADMIPGELVHVWNVANGEWLEIYTIAGPRGSGVVCMNGPATLRMRVGHKIIIAAFSLTDEPSSVLARVVLVDDANAFTGYA